ncbi:hypothetical protein [Aeoliella sp.]|uniref:hypothetical protein n=1 Tax=Aeoliella sp. TaxID=2795800 RepID=UPI003CCB8F54
MSSLESVGWELESAEQRHALAPDSFHIPGREERESLQAGRRVQLLFLMEVSDSDVKDIMCEKMWVTIETVTATCYRGVLDSMPVSSDALSPGDLVEFGPEHISCVLIPKTDPRHPEYDPKP